jgi:hypothetical protein
MSQQEYNYDKEQFFDAETDSGSDNTSYDRLLILQMKKCVEVLSMDRKSCMTRVKTNGNIEETQIRDIDELIINHVETFRILMIPFATEVTDHVSIIEELRTRIKELDDNLRNQIIRLPNGRNVKLEDLPMPENHPLIVVAKQKKSKMYREMFEYLIKSYHDNEEKIKSYSYE